MYRIVNNYIKPDDQFAGALRGISRSDTDEIKKAIISRVREKRPDVSVDSLEAFYDYEGESGSITDTYDVIIKDFFDDKKEIQKEIYDFKKEDFVRSVKVHHSDGRVTKRVKVRRWSLQEEFFLTQMMKRKKMKNQKRSKKEIYDNYIKFFGGLRTKDSVISKLRRMKY